MNLILRFFLTSIMVAWLSLSAQQYQRLEDKEASQLPWHARLLCCTSMNKKINAQSPEKVLCDAAREGNLDSIKQALAQGAIVAATGWDSEDNAICIAWHAGQFDAVKLLLCNGMSMPRNLPVMAVRHDQCDLLEWLLEKKLSDGLTWKQGMTYCCKHERNLSCGDVIHCKACPHQGENTGLQLISFAIGEYKLLSLRTLLHHELNLSQTYTMYTKKVTPLMHALMSYFEASAKNKKTALYILYEIATKNSKENLQDLITEDIIRYALQQNASEQFILNLCSCMRNNDKNFIMPTPLELVVKLNCERPANNIKPTYLVDEDNALNYAVNIAYDKGFMNCVKLLLLRGFPNSILLILKAIENYQSDFFEWLLDHSECLTTNIVLINHSFNKRVYYCCTHWTSEPCSEKSHCVKCPHAKLEDRPLIFYCIEKQRVAMVQALLERGACLTSVYFYNGQNYNAFTLALQKYYEAHNGCNCHRSKATPILQEIMGKYTYYRKAIMESTITNAVSKEESQEFIDHMILCSDSSEGFKNQWIADRNQYLQKKRNTIIKTALYDLCKEHPQKAYDMLGAAETIVENIITHYF